MGPQNIASLLINMSELLMNTPKLQMILFFFNLINKLI